MTPDEIKSAITGWCGQGAGLQLVEDRSEQGADFVLGLRAAAPGSAGTVPVDVRLDQGGDRVTVSSTATSNGAGERVQELLDSRPAAVHGEVDGSSTVLTGHVYTDGFTKHSFLHIVREVAKTRALVDGLSGASAGALAGGDVLGGQPLTAASSEPAQSQSESQSWAPQSPAREAEQATPAYASPAASTPASGFGGTTGTQPSYSPLSGQAAPQAQPSAAFAPTHTVPPQGMQAWAAPDPNGAVVATLGGGLPIQVTEVRGAWAHVLCSNGWTGWVDGRIIGVAH